MVRLGRSYGAFLNEMSNPGLFFVYVQSFQNKLGHFTN